MDDFRPSYQYSLLDYTLKKKTTFDLRGKILPRRSHFSHFCSFSHSPLPMNVFVLVISSPNHTYKNTHVYNKSHTITYRYTYTNTHICKETHKHELTKHTKTHTLIHTSEVKLDLLGQIKLL